MYSDSDSEDEAPLVIRRAAPTAHDATLETERRVASPPETADTAAASQRECTDIPEEYLERCAVLVDFMSLFPDVATCAVEENPVVEGFVRLVRYPLCGRSALAFGDRSLLCAPTVDLRSMQRGKRSALLATLDRAVENVHGIAPRVLGTGERSRWNEFTVIMQKAAEDQKTSRTNVCLAEFSSNATEMRSRVRLSIDTIVEQAVQCCQEEGVDAAVAFLTPASRKAAVQHALLWFQACCGVVFPRYRIFTLEAVADDRWESLLHSRFSRFAFSRDCPLHSRTVLNQYGNPFHCCLGTVLDLHRVLIQASEMVEVALEDRALHHKAAPPAPAVEYDDDDNV